MDQMKFDQILEAVNVETANRSKGSFKRALWYGNNNMWIGQNKGLRKGIQNAPKQLFMSSLGAIPLPPGISDIFSEAVNIALNKGKEIYGDEVKPWIKSKRSGTAIDAQRRNIKKDVKEMQAGAFQYIDRNLVKLKDAKNKIDPAVQAMMRTQATSQAVGGFGKNAVSSEAEGKSAHNALRAIAETQHYIDKLATHTTAAKDACDRIMENLNQLKIGLEKNQQEVSDYIKEYM